MFVPNHIKEALKKQGNKKKVKQVGLTNGKWLFLEELEKDLFLLEVHSNNNEGDTLEETKELLIVNGINYILDYDTIITCEDLKELGDELSKGISSTTYNTVQEAREKFDIIIKAEKRMLVKDLLNIKPNLIIMLNDDTTCIFDDGVDRVSDELLNKEVSRHYQFDNRHLRIVLV